MVSNELSQSTIHNVSNILRQQLTKSRLIWTVLMFISLLLFIYHATMLTQKLLKNEVVASTKRTNFIKPDVVFCFYHPFDQLFMQYPVGSDEDFMRNISRQVNDILTRKHRMDMFLNKLILFDTVGIRNIYKAFFQKHLLLPLQCNFDCNISYEFHYDFYACIRVSRCKCPNFRFVMNSYSAENYSSELHSKDSMDFYTKDLLNTMDEPFNPNSLAVYFMHGNHHADILQPDMILNPGVTTTIELRKSVQHIRQNRNDFRCDEDRFEAFYNPLANITAQHGQHVNYSHSSVCRYLSVQLCMYAKWKCVLSSLPIPVYIPANVPFCFDAAFGDLEDKYRHFIYNCRNASGQCARPCDMVTYKIRKREQFKDSSIRYHFADYVSWADQWASKNSSIVPEIAAFKSKFVVSDRFKQSYRGLWLRTVHDGSEIIEESFAYTFRDLFADIGGILGFYVGFSMLTICEIFSMVQSLISYRREKGNLPKQSKGNTQQTIKGGDVQMEEEAQLAGSSECGPGDVNGVSVANIARLNERIATLENRFASLESAVETLTMEISKISQSVAQ